YIAEVGVNHEELKIPAALLRRRVVERITERPALLNTDPPFVGRELEMAALGRKLMDARKGAGSSMLVVGDPGIGKSRLSAEVFRFAELQGALTQRASCRRADIDRPLSLFVDIVPQLREMPGALVCAPASFTFLKRLTEFEQGTQDSLHPGDSDILFRNLLTAMFYLFDSITEELCLLLLIEDIQWLDVTSAKILSRMVDRCSARPLFLLLNSRPGGNAFVDYTDGSRINTITLGPLHTPASSALLHSVALRPGDRLQPEFVDWCLEVADGNPLFLQELAHHWIETGKQYEAPPSVSRVLQERLSRVSDQALQVLQTCAVLGEQATLARVQQVLQCPSHRLLLAVEELSKAAMLGSQVEREGGDPPLRLRHELLSTAAVRRLAAVSLAFLHRRSAEVLEEEITQGAVPT
ncbi:MAG: ATP-binding protein, partial [Terriglobales bacterium]